MQTFQAGYRSFGLLLSINWDWLLYVFAIVVALFLGGFLGSLMIEAMTHSVRY